MATTTNKTLDDVEVSRVVNRCEHIIKILVEDRGPDSNVALLEIIRSKLLSYKGSLRKIPNIPDDIVRQADPELLKELFLVEDTDEWTINELLMTKNFSISDFSEE